MSTRENINIRLIARASSTIVTFGSESVNPYKPSVLFVGHMQTVQTKSGV